MTARMKVAFLVCFAAGALALMVADATANLTRGSGRMVFRGRISHQDPVNLIFTGGSDQSPGTVCQGANARSPDCLRDHLRTDWTMGDGMETEFCQGDADLVFYRQVGGTASSQQDVSVGTSDECEDQYHIRAWDDATHGHNTSNHQWMVGAIHSEERGTFEFGSGAHKPDAAWEFAENVAIEQIGHREKGTTEPSHCTYPDYRRLVHSGPGKIRGFYTNGRISRVSWHHIGDGGCEGQ